MEPQTASPMPKTISYSAETVIGHDSFGVVFLAKIVETGDAVVIKKVLQDKRFKNRELQIMRMINHRNLVILFAPSGPGGKQPIRRLRRSVLRAPVAAREGLATQPEVRKTRH